MTERVTRLGAILATRRDVLCLSIRDVAYSAGCSPAQVFRLESGDDNNPGVEILVGLADALRVPFLQLASAAALDIRARREIPS